VISKQQLSGLNPACRTSRDLLVFTDLDGTLLDHDSYSYAAALPALAALREAGIPLILASSKTRAEIRSLASKLDLAYPFIVENGAGVVVPDTCFSALDGPSRDGVRLHAFGPPLASILATLHQLRDESGVHFIGFSEMDDDEVMRRTGLSRTAAGQARAREFCEPIAWQDDEASWPAFAARLQAAGLYSLRGGRFIHIMSGGDKGAALAWLRDQYVEERGRPACTLALGDSDNDVAMLARADIPVVVRSTAHVPPAEAYRQNWHITERAGPAGWNDIVLAIVRIMDQ
jgi:mannosyl-3-phosphoglycerate phosphatase family protein